jgi:hypothetical protein
MSQVVSYEVLGRLGVQGWRTEKVMLSGVSARFWHGGPGRRPDAVFKRRVLALEF